MQVEGPVEMSEADISCAVDNRGDFVVAIDTDIMGRGSDELGKRL